MCFLLMLIDTAINQVDSPQCENKLRFVRLSLPLRRTFLPKAATFALHDPKSDCLATGFCETRYSLRSGSESINHRSLSTLFIAGAINKLLRPVILCHSSTNHCGNNAHTVLLEAKFPYPIYNQLFGLSVLNTRAQSAKYPCNPWTPLVKKSLFNTVRASNNRETISDAYTSSSESLAKVYLIRSYLTNVH